MANVRSSFNPKSDPHRRNRSNARLLLVLFGPFLNQVWSFPTRRGGNSQWHCKPVFTLVFEGLDLVLTGLLLTPRPKHSRPAFAFWCHVFLWVNNGKNYRKMASKRNHAPRGVKNRADVISFVLAKRSTLQNFSFRLSKNRLVLVCDGEMFCVSP